MAKAPPILSFKKGDYGSDGLGSQSALDKFFPQINGWMAAVRSALAGGLTSDNTISEVKTFNVTTPTSPWTAITFSNSWIAVNSSPRYRKDQNGIVWVEGRCSTGTTATSAITTLPAGYRPGNQILLAVRGPGVWSSLSVGPDGQLVPIENSTTADYSFNCSFSCADLSPGVLSCFPLTVATTVTNPVKVSVMQVSDLSTTPQTMALGNLDWTRLNGAVRINNLPGLLLGKTYKLSLLIEGQ